MKGILLAGGKGSRLLPATKVLTKHLLPVFDKPLIYYPLCVLMSAGIRDILIVSDPKSIHLLRDLLEDGAQWGMQFHYRVQEEPRGIAEVFLIAADFINHEPCALALGDNIFLWKQAPPMLNNASLARDGATIFAQKVPDPSRFGVVELDADGRPVSIEEKPVFPKSDLAIPGLYFYDGNVVEIARSLTPSERGELEISDVNRAYLERGALRAIRLSDDVQWFDAGTPESLMGAAYAVCEAEAEWKTKVGAPETIAWSADWITSENLRELATFYQNSYGRHLRELAEHLK